MARRGSYAKGVAKRDEILEAALEVIAREGYRGASVKELAEAVGLSQAGLLHYFDSKDELFTAILRKRDEVDSRRFGAMDDDAPLERIRDGFVDVVRHNAEVPGLVQLFSRLAVEAGDPEHPAHAYFVERTDSLRRTFADALERQQQEGRITGRVPAETLARIVQALADGLQLQWMQDPSVDMPATVASLFDLLAREA
ncbi:MULTISPECIES: TetR/AcrR family transcriptional regulator [unclassified Leifsonia]|uniref:TetR/AcrR family transcriptional regulator n=1 Tax=unclassified Leifsonia TaxID=2663824 RepID=UPI0008A724ED|nr:MULTISPECIES: TetR/AcrR family transcriptional regulator [unclassified Leifsonia]SEH84998.1 DNA-binding transcriptional regulator, AcrR family [Leifsonia sp. CL154]SFL47547.1 DNA-binding transcriptional regulator, AcrR family [Leifsonia sp. CL147]